VTAAPRVSVILPTYNRAELLPRALRSVLAQSYADYEVLVVDNGSTDATASLAGAFADPRIRWLRVETRGASAARNAAISVALGEWVAFLDDDDEWEPTFLDRQLATAAESGAVVVSCWAVEERASEPPLVHAPPTDAQPGLDAMTRGWHPFVGCVIVRRDALVAAGGFVTGLSVREDWHLLLRLALTVRFAATPEPLMVRHHHWGARLGNDDDAALAADRVLDRDFGAAIRREAGVPAYSRWYRWHCGDDEIQRMWRDAPTRGRAAAAGALLAMARRLPWSASSIARPAAVLVLGPPRYRRLRTARRRPT